MTEWIGEVERSHWAVIPKNKKKPSIIDLWKALFNLLCLILHFQRDDAVFPQGYIFLLNPGEYS
jgi:hypothetical protein